MTAPVRNAWYMCAWSADLGAGLLHRKLLGENVLMYRREDGTPVLLGDTCPHRFAPLHKGQRIGDSVQCPYHGLRFGPEGRCVHNPHGAGAIPAAARVRTWPVVERNGIVWMWSGEPQGADPALLPDYAFLDDRPEYAYTVGCTLTMQARYDLILDNLFDLSHAWFLHPASLGSEAMLRARVDLKQEGNTLHYLSVYPDHTPAGIFVMTRALEPAARVDYWVDVHWTPPGAIHLATGSHPVGGKRSDGVEFSTVQLLTPESDGATHYFVKVYRDYHIDDADLSRGIAAAVTHAFTTEDEPMVLAVQERMAGRELFDMNPVLLPTDGPAVRARRVLEEMRAAEARASAA